MGLRYLKFIQGRLRISIVAVAELVTERESDISKHNHRASVDHSVTLPP